MKFIDDILNSINNMLSGSQTRSPFAEPKKSLNDIIDEHHNRPLRWTEEEIAEWITNLPEEKQKILLDAMVKDKQNGLNDQKLLRLVCDCRETYEKNQPSWLGSALHHYWEFRKGWFEADVITGGFSDKLAKNIAKEIKTTQEPPKW